MIECLFVRTFNNWRFSQSTRRAVRAVCDSVDHEIRALLPSLPAQIEVIVKVGTHVLPATGDHGFAATPHRVVWTADGSLPGGVVGIAEHQLRPTLFHELHHLARGWVKSNYRIGVRLIDAAVSEGLATAFERDFGGRTAPWASYPPDTSAWVEELMGLPAGASYKNWMFHHPDGRRWIGYRAGTFVADRAMAASGRSSADLAMASTSEVLRLAGLGVAG